MAQPILKWYLATNSQIRPRIGVRCECTVGAIQPTDTGSLGHERPFSLASKISAHLRTSGSCKSLQRPDPTGARLYPFVLQSSDEMRELAVAEEAWENS